MKKHYLLLVLLTAFNGLIYSQDTPTPIDYVTVDQSKSIEDLVTKVLVKEPCMAVSGITATAACGVGYFNRNNSNFPFKEGMVIRSGEAVKTGGKFDNTNESISSGCSKAGDADLQAINTANGNPGSINDASFVKFNFTAGTADFSFRYLFASQEYGQYQCHYSDEFAFILKDETAGTPAHNLAVIPGTATATSDGIPVTVTSIRQKTYNAQCEDKNPQYFGIYNASPAAAVAASAINMKGQTKVLTATSKVIPGHNYSVKMVIGDYNDMAYDSAVFIEAASFTSGPPECLDKIKLIAFVDANANGIQDNGEKDFNYGSFVLQKNNTDPSTTISASNGSYTMYETDPSNTYDFSFQIDSEYSAYYSATPTNFNDINVPAGSGTTSLYFPVKVTKAYKDLSVTVIPLGEPVPGGSYVNQIVYKNMGTITANGTVTFTKPNVATIASISQSGTVATSTGFKYDFTALAPNETRIINVTIYVPASVNLGDVLSCTSTISAALKGIGNSTTSRNSQIVVPSFASSRITEAHTEKIPFSSFSANDYLTYTIHFQNTGTANATSVRIEDVLNAKMDINSLRIINSSHKYVSEIIGNKLVCKMNYINLVGAAQSETLSKGYITFKVKLLPGLAMGDIIPNQADIYFDANDAVATNTFNTQFTATLGVDAFEAENIQLFPNPANDLVQVRLNNSIETLDSITVYDLSGKIVQKVSGIAANQSGLSVGSLGKGMYLLQITTQSKMKTTKKLIVN